METLDLEEQLLCSSDDPAKYEDIRNNLLVNKYLSEVLSKTQVII